MQMKRITRNVAILGLGLVTAGCASVDRTTDASGGACHPSAAANKNTVLSLYRQALIERSPRGAFERHVSPDFVEHKPDIPAGTREATIAFLEKLIKEVPDPRWEILRTAAEGDLVFLHARFTPAQGAPAYAIADVFRLENCLIVEHWDVVAPPREPQPNPGSRF